MKLITLLITTITAFIFMLFFIASCTGSEIGNPADPGDKDSSYSGDDRLFISVQELQVLTKLGDDFDVFKLYSYRQMLTTEESEIMDSIIVKAVNRVYYNKAVK